MAPKYIVSLVLLYVLIAMITFGCAFNLEYKPSTSPFANGDRLFATFGCALGWPLYWSVKATQHLRPTL